MTVHDITKPYWGHNYSVINWDRGEIVVWLSPGPKQDDIIILPGHNGPIRTVVKEVKWLVTVDDMYSVTVRPAPIESKEKTKWWTFWRRKK